MARSRVMPSCFMKRAIATQSMNTGFEQYYKTLHWLCAWLGVGVTSLHSGIFNGNSEDEWNPVFRQSGRHEGPHRSQTYLRKNFTPSWACGARAADYAARVLTLQARCAVAQVCARRNS